jgi:hypothetical protein
MPTGYTSVGTTFYWAGAPMAAVSKIPTFPAVTGPGQLDTTPLSAVWKTNIPDGLMGSSAFEVELITAVGGPAALQAIIAAKTIDTIEIRLTNGRSIKAATAWLSDLKLGGAAGASSPGCLLCTVTVNVSGELKPDEATTGNWYDALIGLAPIPGDFGITAVTSPLTMDIRAVFPGGFSMVAPNADLDFTSSVPAKATAGLHTGIITFVAAGDTVIQTALTTDPTINCSCTCTAS